jgi:hypothetical protein
MTLEREALVRRTLRALMYAHIGVTAAIVYGVTQKIIDESYVGVFLVLIAFVALFLNIAIVIADKAEHEALIFALPLWFMCILVGAYLHFAYIAHEHLNPRGYVHCGKNCVAALKAPVTFPGLFYR